MISEKKKKEKNYSEYRIIRVKVNKFKSFNHN